MNCQAGTIFRRASIVCAVSLFMAHAQTAPFSKAQVADRIRKVEDGVDQFRKYLENRGEDTKNRAASAQRRATAPSTFSFAECTSPGGSNQTDEGRSRGCHGRSESHHEPLTAQVRSHRIIWRRRRKWNRSWTAHGASIRSWLRGITALRRNDTGQPCGRTLMILRGVTT